MRYSTSIKNMVFLFVFTILTAVSCVDGDDSVESVKLALDWYPNANHIGLYIAQEKGYFKEENLEVEIYTPSDPSTVLQTVASGSDNFGINYQPDVLIARGEGVPVVSILGMVQHPLNSMMTLQSSPFDTPSSLKGKKVGYPGIPWNVDALSTMLKSDGLSGVEDVELVNVGWELGSSLIAQKVDAIIGAYFTHESIALENQGHPVNVLRMEEWGVPDYYELVMVTSEGYLKSNPKVVEKFTRAVSRGYSDAIKDPAAGIEILKKYEPEIDVDIDKPGSLLLQLLWQDKNGKFGRQTEDKWVGFADWMKDKAILPENVEPEDAYTDEYSLK
jgi:putative hydroxymethylpyrimidine transport system substrate-binding protein